MSPLLAQIGDIVDQWKEEFEDLLYPTTMSSTEESEESFITFGRVPGVDETHPNMLKGSVKACRSGTTPVVPILRRPDRVFQLWGEHTKSPLESLLQGVGKEAPTDLRSRRSSVVSLRGSYEFDHPVCMCFVDLEKAYDRGIPLRDSARIECQRCFCRLFNQSKSCVHFLGIRSDSDRPPLVTDPVFDCHGQKESGGVVGGRRMSGLHLYSLRMMWFCWFFEP